MFLPLLYGNLSNHALPFNLLVLIIFSRMAAIQPLYHLCPSPLGLAPLLLKGTEHKTPVVAKKVFVFLFLGKKKSQIADSCRVHDPPQSPDLSSATAWLLFPTMYLCIQVFPPCV